MSTMRKKHNTPWSEKTRGVIDELKGEKMENPQAKISVSWVWPDHIYDPDKQVVGYPGTIGASATTRRGEPSWPNHIYKPEEQFVMYPGAGTGRMQQGRGTPNMTEVTDWSKSYMTGKTPYAHVEGGTTTWESHEDYMRRRREEAEKLQAQKTQRKQGIERVKLKEQPMVDFEVVLKRAAHEVKNAKENRGDSTLPPDDSEDMNRVRIKTKQEFGLVEDSTEERLDSLDRDIRDIKLYLRAKDPRTVEWYDK